MPIHFTCPHCAAATDVAEQYAGQSGPCARCGQSITVPPLGADSPFDSHAAPPKRGLGVGLTLLIGLAVAVPVLLVCGGILLALLLPAVGGAREAARRAACNNNLKQIGLAMHCYHEQYKCFPPAFIPDENGQPKHSWRVLLLPFMEEQALYAQYRFDEPWDSPNNKALAAQMPSVYRCPSDSDMTAGKTSYAMLVGPHAISDGPTPRRLSDIRDGSSNTIMIVEAAGADINWLEPRDLDTKYMSFGINRAGKNAMIDFADISSNHTGVANVLFADGSVRSLSASIDSKILEAMTTIDGGEAVGPPDF
jgi:prepilin-type processing-associated H-X9-DG protein